MTRQVNNPTFSLVASVDGCATLPTKTQHLRTAWDLHSLPGVFLRNHHGYLQPISLFSFILCTYHFNLFLGLYIYFPSYFYGCGDYCAALVIPYPTGCCSLAVGLGTYHPLYNARRVN